MIDIMLFVEFQARRTEMLERAGFTDDFCSSDKMFDYVLDALGAPANGTCQKFCVRGQNS